MRQGAPALALGIVSGAFSCVGGYLDTILFHQRIDSIRHFLDHVLEGITAELAEVDKKVDLGTIKELTDLEEAQDQPIGRAIIAIRAALYEINALFETYLYRAAYLPWSKTESVRPKSIFDVPAPVPYNLRNLELVTDLKFPKVVKLIESHYEIHLSEIPGWNELMAIRTEVNSHKHMAGMIDFRLLPPDDVTAIGSTYTVDSQKAYDGLDTITKFLTALHEQTRRK
ncbi:MAG: hypothetical protein WBP29_03815 [Candidatus Zixiibacteriota bacterium]